MSSSTATGTAASKAQAPTGSFLPSIFASTDSASSNTRSTTVAAASASAVKSEEHNFRASLLKFERINAHLANERTWLAWIRTAVSILGCSFTFLTLANNSASGVDWACIALGCGFVVCTFATFATGWSRYRQVKGLLSLKLDDLNENFERLGVGHQSRLLGSMLFFTGLLYFTGGWMEWLWQSEEK
jgi:hypothetical protein